MKNEKFIIPLNGLHAGRSIFSWCVGKEFFAEFDNSDILNANLKIDVTIEKSGAYTGIDCYIDGIITVLCDRCLDELELPIHTKAKFSVKFGQAPSSENEIEESEDREVLYIPFDDAEIDISQIIYDYSLLAIPMHRVHNEGECNIEVIKHLIDDSEMSDNISSNQETGRTNENSPFAVLKDLLKN